MATVTKGNIHTPERIEGESMAQYRARRADSKSAYRASVRPPHQAPALSPLDTSRFWLGQHTADKASQLKRRQVEMVGIRQYKRIKRAHGIAPV